MATPPNRTPGKEVVLSSLVLLEAESEMNAMRSLCENGRFAIEANDIGVAYMASELGVPFIGGHTLNIYNTRTLATWARLGMTRWLPPLELSRDGVSAILSAWPADVPLPETEVFAWGRLPLAHSARCYTARARNLPKDQCEFACIEYPDGVPLYTQEHQGLFQINGIQTTVAGAVEEQGLPKYYPEGTPPAVRETIEKEPTADEINQVAGRLAMVGWPLADHS